MIARLILAAALLAQPVPATTALAQDDVPKWTVQPATTAGPTGQPSFSWEGQPGQRFEDYVAVSNLGTTPLTFTVYATDAYTAQDGSFALLPLLDQPVKLGSWMSMPPRSYAITPGTRVIIPVKFEVPANATPGDHAAGIVASVTEEVNTPEGKRVNVDRRVATRAYLRVAGPVEPGLTISDVTMRYANGLFNGDLTVSYRLRNTGNIRVKGDSRVEATGPFGLGLGSSPRVDMPELLPGADVVMTTTVSSVIPLGQLTGSVIANPTSSEGLLAVASQSASIWVAPWVYLGLLVLVIALVVAFVWWRRRQRATTVMPWPA